MNFCCENCFSSVYIKSIITSSGKKGKCDFCDSDEVSLFTPSDLVQLFMNLIDIYEIHDDGAPIEEKLVIDFPNEIFSSIPQLKIKDLLYKIFIDNIDIYGPKLKEKVLINKKLVPDSSLTKSWEGFVKEIKEVNRFHINSILDKIELEGVFSELIAYRKKGDIFFRARKGDKTTLGVEHMGKPPKESSINGRANPRGISYLYLASEEETTYYEVKANLLNNITVGTFRLNKDIALIDLRESSHYGDILQAAESEGLDSKFLSTKFFIKKLDSELSTPYVESEDKDKELDYLPTQYICEFIKSLGYSGVIYKSSISPTGHNLVIFDGNELECIERKVIKIEAITFTATQIGSVIS